MNNNNRGIRKGVKWNRNAHVDNVVVVAVGTEKCIWYKNNSEIAY